MPSPNLTSTTLDESEGVKDRADAISMDLDEDKINTILGTRIDDGKTFYDSKLKLSTTRDDNEKRWMNQNLEVSGKDIYDHQLAYRDNRVFISIETLVAQLVPKIPTPEVIEAHDTNASRELAWNYEKVLMRTAQDIKMRAHFRMATRHVLMGYRCGIIKTRWDFSKGRRKENGEFLGAPVISFVRPHKVIVDADATDPDDIPLIAETLSATVEELTIDFPDKKDEIIREFIGKDVEDPEKVDLGTRVNYTEVWFTFHEDGVRHEGLCWKYKNLILAYGLNPNWNYDEGEGSNFLDMPVKPYVFINFLRIGRWIYDDTSLTEQASSQQDNLEKRGLQIIDNADQANAAKVWNTDMIEPKDAQKYVGDPHDNIMASGDVRMAFARVPAPPLPRYVVEDKYDARSEIDDIFGTHAPIRGASTDSPTLGQEVLSQRTDLGRTVPLSEVLEEAGTSVYGQITQLYKVFAKEEHIVKHLGEEGKTTFIKFSSDKIEDGLDVRVQAGSLQPEDKISDRNEAVELAKIGGRLDPLTFAEKWHLAKPREFATRMFYFLFMPEKYAQETLKIGQAGGDEEAMANIQQTNAGENIPPKKDASKEYVAYYGQFMESPAFKQLDPEVQRLHIDHIEGTVSVVKGGLKEGKAEGEEKPNVMSQIVTRLRKEKT